MNVLITGAYGFVGISLVRRFAAAGNSVLALDLGEADPPIERFLGAELERVLGISTDIADARLR